MPSALPLPDAIDAISLDLDDTLWPVMPTLVEAERTMHRWLQANAPRTAERSTVDRIRQIRQRVAAGNAGRAHDMAWLRRESLRMALLESGDDPAHADAAFDVFYAARQQVTLYQDVLAALARWRDRYRLVVVTNGNADVDRIGIGHFFSARVASHELGVGKPDPRIFHEACAQIGVAPSRTLHVGDDLALDVAGARAAGLHAAWLRRPDIHGSGDHPEPGFADLHALDRALRATQTP